MLNATDYDESEFYIQSTNVNRTMQSGYSELMGLYPPGKGTPLTAAQLDAVTNGVARPPFKVRDAEKINEKIGLDALPGRPIQVPIFSYNNGDINDQVSYAGCPFIGDTESQRSHDDKVFEKYDFMIEQDRGPIEKMYNLTDDYIDSLSYNGFETLTDEATGLDYEGTEHVHDKFFSDQEWEVNHQF